MSVTVEQDGDVVIVCIPMTIKRRLGRKEIIVPSGLGETPTAEAQEPLVVAVARALLWETLLDEGRYASIAALAQALGVDRRYVARILNLATLAPDIVEAMVNGEEPSGMSLERLMKGIPMEWEEQRKMLGFSSRTDYPSQYTFAAGAAPPKKSAPRMATASLISVRRSSLKSAAGMHGIEPPWNR
jgi:hypothetical protein